MPYFCPDRTRFGISFIVANLQYFTFSKPTEHNRKDSGPVAVASHPNASFTFYYIFVRFPQLKINK